MTRKHRSPTERARLFLLHGGRCHLCEGKIHAEREAWELEHVTALAMGGDESDDNVKPAHVKCHQAKTKQDVANLYRAIRRQNRHKGIHRPKSIMSGSRLSRWRKKLNGEVVLR